MNERRFHHTAHWTGGFDYVLPPAAPSPVIRLRELVGKDELEKLMLTLDYFQPIVPQLEKLVELYEACDAEIDTEPLGGW